MQGPSPAAATVAKLRDELGLELVPGTGLLPAVVPGAFDAWMLILRDHGTISVAEALAPAIAYARNGVPLVPRVPATIATMQPLFEQEWKTSAAFGSNSFADIFSGRGIALISASRSNE